MKYSEMPEFGNLKGINVVAIGSAISYGTAATLLGEHGANVTTVETPITTDVIRASYPFIWVQEHRNSRFLDVNIKTDEGREIFLKLIAKTDILICAGKGGSYARWGYSDETLWEINPKLAIVHISGYGEYGDPEYVQRASYDFSSQSFSGYAYWQGIPSLGVKANYAKPVTADVVTGYYGAFSALMAYTGAQRTGKGESVEVTQYETLLRMQSQFPTLGFTLGFDQTGFDGFDQFMAGDGFYITKDDRPVCIAVTGTEITKRMLKVLGMENDERFHGIPTVMKYMDKQLVDDFTQAMRDYAASKTIDEVETEMNALGIPCSRAMKYTEMMEHPHYQAREDIVEYHTSYLDMDVKGPNCFPKTKVNEAKVWRGAACKGEDNEDILAELGYSEEEIAALYDKGILEKGEIRDPEIEKLRKMFEG